MRGVLRHGLVIALLLGCLAVLAGCERSGQNGAAPSNEKVPAAVNSNTAEKQMDPDMERDSILYADLLKSSGAVSKAGKSYKLGTLVRFLGNPYYQLLTDGMCSKAKELGVSIDFQAGANESDQAGQFTALESMIDRGYHAILVSPQTDLNLESAVAKAKQKRVLLINVDAAVLSEARYYVGPNQYENGVRAAQCLTDKVSGGEVAILRGQYEDYGVSRRVRGFAETLAAGSFQIVADPECACDLQIAFQHAAEIIEEHPNIVCLYCTSDIMALGAVQAVKFAGRSDRVIVIGRDGIPAAIDSIRSGGLNATVDTFPFETGRAAVDIAVRILEGKEVRRVVVTPQELISGKGTMN